MILAILLNETHKRLLILWDYKFNMLTQMFTIGFVFIGIGFFMGGGDLVAQQLAPALLGYLIWFYAAIAIGDMSWGLREEVQTGTLEQMYMSPVPTPLLILGRSLATLIEATVMVGIVAIALVLLLGVHMPVRWEGLPAFGLTMAGLYGFGFLIGGATLVFKQVESFANLVTNALLFLNGALLPVDRLPEWLETFARTLPTTQGIIVLRNIMIDGQSLASAWKDGSLVWLTIHSAVYFIGGWLVFQGCENIARQRGTLGQY